MPQILKKNIFVIGCGRWGTFIAWYLDKIGHEVSLYGREQSANMQELLTERKNKYLTLSDTMHLTTTYDDLKNADYIIIDSSPVSVAADTEIISSHVDAVLLVIKQDWAQITEINRFIEVLSKNNTDFLGYVLNDFENQSPIGKKQYNYGYGKYYEKYGYGENDK